MAASDPDSSAPQGDEQALPESPLKPCRYATNCVRESRAFAADPDRLFDAAERAVRRVSGVTIGSAQEVRPDPSARRFSARFRVFGFSDDLAVAVVPHGDGAVLHVRSASRTGRGDFGVNRRRIKAFFEKLEEALDG